MSLARNDDFWIDSLNVTSSDIWPGLFGFVCSLTDCTVTGL